MNCPNPFRDNPDWDWAFRKWGQPNNLGAYRDQGFRYKCERCLAEWVGPNGDVCDWCHTRWVNQQADDKQALLLPEWLSWGDRYVQASDLDREIWANTRGFRGDFQSPWLRKLKAAHDAQQITRAELVAAIQRFRRWKLTIQSKPSNKS